MPEPTLTQIFGANATQDNGEIALSKADFVDVGLTASANNTGEAIVCAFVKKGALHLTEENQANNPDQSIVITGPTLGYTNNTTGETYQTFTYSIELRKLVTGAARFPDPDDF